MAQLESAEGIEQSAAPANADLVIAIAGPVGMEKLRELANGSIFKLPSGDPGNRVPLANLRTVVAYPAPSGTPESSPEAALGMNPPSNGGGLRFLSYSASMDATEISWLASSTAYQPLFAMAHELKAGACAVVAPDLAALQDDTLMPLIEPVLSQHCDLSMPFYNIGKFEGLLNSGILAPLTRALYGKRVGFPLALDFAVSARFLPALENPTQRALSQGRTLLWPATEAALRDRKICQVHVDVRHPGAADLDVSTLIAQIVGPLFADMEANAALWQRIRGSQPVEISGVPRPQQMDGAAADVRPMLETFTLGFRNLQEVWSLILPPVSLLDLKRLTRMDPSSFRMPDELWVRIVYDFALAYRLRTLSRNHLLGALTPIYLGWAASHVLEVAKIHPHEAAYRVEKLARAYEEGKPYLLSRWRWPDRFHP